MTSATATFHFSPVELALAGTLADDRAAWTITDPVHRPPTLRHQLERAAAIQNTAEPLPLEPRHSDREATPSAISINWTRLSRAGLTSGASARLYKLAMRTDGWRGSGSRALNSVSLAGFLAFWSSVSGQATEPHFTLLPNGHLGAEWYKNSRHHLDIEFADDQIAYFGLFSGKTEIEGIENPQVIAKSLLGHPAKPLRWKSI
jgi:hypothetical protein